MQVTTWAKIGVFGKQVGEDNWIPELIRMDSNKDGVISFEEFIQGIKDNVLDGVEVKWGPAEQMRQASMRGIDAEGVKHSLDTTRMR